MTREELLKSPDYWVAGIQIDLYNCAERYMAEKGMNRTQLAASLGVSKGYISQLLNGNYDHKLSKLVELALAFGYVPKVEFTPIDQYIEMEQRISTAAAPTGSNYRESSVCRFSLEYGVTDDWNNNKLKEAA